MKNRKKSVVSLFWDLTCIGSVIGIWPRFIEPRCLKSTRLQLHIENLPEDLNHLKIAHFSDLHFHENISQNLLNKILKKIETFRPDIIFFTGDFLCHSVLDNVKRLYEFLNEFSAPYGCYAVLGNHDYSQKIGVNNAGEYDLLDKNRSEVLVGFKRLLRPIQLSGIITQRAQNISRHEQLIDLLEKTPFQLLHNSTKLIPIKNSYLNICGVGEHMVGQCIPDLAFKGWKKEFPGIVLAHNPDSLPKLLEYPGDIYLCGHTHGGQVNIPRLWHRFTLMENPQFKRGLFHIGNRKIYVNRGVGSTLPFRFCAMPEIGLITLEKLCKK